MECESTSNNIHLTGISSSNPLAVMASFGLLRVCDQIKELNDSRLFWETDDGEGFLDEPHAVLEAPDGVDEKRLLCYLADYNDSDLSQVLSWDEDIRMQPEKFKDLITGYLSGASHSDRLLLDYLCAFGSELVTDTKKLVKPSALYMISGRQKFLSSLLSIREALFKDRNKTFEAFHEALIGPWNYNDEHHSLGWDPSTERLYALRNKAPTAEKPRSVIAAVWLAFNSLPLYPTAISSRQKLVTTGFSRTENQVDSFVWPIWKYPIGLDSLRSLLASSELAVPNKRKDALIRRGIFAVYKSVRSELVEGRWILRPATIEWCL